MIKMTYKCKILPLKLDCFVFLKFYILTNLKRESLLQYFLTRFSNNMTRTNENLDILTGIERQHMHDGEGGGDDEDDEQSGTTSDDAP